MRRNMPGGRRLTRIRRVAALSDIIMKKISILIVILLLAGAGGWIWRDRLPVSVSAPMERAVAMVPGLGPLIGASPQTAGASGKGDGQGSGQGGGKRSAQTAQGEAQGAGGQGAGQGGGRRGGGRNGGPATVKTVIAQNGVLPIEVVETGWAEADQNTTIAAQEAGLIVSIAVEDGALVKQGDLIAKIDDRTARATIAKDQAIIDRDMATLAQAETELTRRASLVKANAAAQDTADQAKAARDTAAATVESDKATLAADQIVLEKTEIRAPFDGRLGAVAISHGAYVNAGTAIVTIVKYDPIYATFHVPESLFDPLSTAMAKAPVPVEAALLSANAKPLSGKLSFLDNAIEQASGTVLAKARFDNPAGAIWPGQSIQVTVHMPNDENHIILPNVAITPGADRPFVYVVKDDTVHIVPVTTGRSDGERMEVLSGLEAGAHVVVEGQVQLNDGQRVIEQSAVADAGKPMQAKTETVALGDAK